MEGEKEKKEFLNDVVKNQDVTRAIVKLGKKVLPVNIHRHVSLVKAIKDDLAKIPEILKDETNEKIKADLETLKVKREEALAKEEKDRIEGVLTTLTYRDMNDIKAAVTEALIHFSDYNFDTNVKMARVVAEERYMTVFCALKRSDDPTKKYFSTLEELSQVEDETLFELYDLWFKTFVLTDSEIKNS